MYPWICIQKGDTGTHRGRVAVRSVQRAEVEREHARVPADEVRAGLGAYDARLGAIGAFSERERN